MIIKFVKLPQFSGYFVFFFGVNRVYCNSMPDDDFIKRAGWDPKDFGKTQLIIDADSNELKFNLG
jgi:hypothetical protein